MPLKNMLMPTSVPIAQMVLNGHVLQIMTARMIVTAPSRIIQGRPLRSDLEGEDDLEDSLDQEIDGQEERQREQSGQGMQDEVAAGEEIDDADEHLPQDCAGGMRLPGEDEVGDSAEDQQPADVQGDAQAHDGRKQDGGESRQDQQDAERNGPADGFAGDRGARGGCIVSWRSPPEAVMPSQLSGEENTTGGIVPR